MKLQGSSVVITGGSRGLGRALGIAAARAGARVVLVGRRREPLAQVVAEINARGGEAHAVIADVSDKDAVHAIAGQAAALVGPIDVLVNNASTLGPVPLRPLMDTDCEDLERALAVNLTGAFRLAKVLLGPMLLRRRGVVVNLSSDAAVAAYPAWGAYSAAKAGLDQLTRVWAAELAGTGVRLLAVDPGEMDTDMHAAAMPDADRAALADPARVAAALLRLITGEDAPADVRVAVALPPAARAPAAEVRS
jgi:NAD(P)-dependent dehydrogenase (short-subunit alcohol dehydrogenase family)